MPITIPKQKRDLTINYFDLIPNPAWKIHCDTDNISRD
jgi:hypothetical protein